MLVWFGFFYKYLSTKHRCLKIAVFSFMETISHQGMSCVCMEYKIFSGNFKTQLFYLLYLFLYLFVCLFINLLFIYLFISKPCQLEFTPYLLMEKQVD